LLLEALRKLGLQEKAYLATHLIDRPNLPLLGPDDLIDQIRAWKGASGRALSNLKERTGKGGKPLNIPLRYFIRELHRIYRVGTGRDDRITKYSDREEPQYGGRFFDFVSACFGNLGISKTNTQLGKAIEKSLKGIPKTPTQ